MDISERNSTVKSVTPDDPKNKIEQAASQDNASAAKNSHGADPGGCGGAALPFSGRVVLESQWMP
jgi:hypothetical protein